MRKRRAVKRDVLPDPIYKSKIVAKLINTIMLDGKTSLFTARLLRIFKSSLQKYFCLSYYLDFLAPYLLRPCLRSLTPAVSKVPRIM